MPLISIRTKHEPGSEGEPYVFLHEREFNIEIKEPLRRDDPNPYEAARARAFDKLDAAIVQAKAQRGAAPEFSQTVSE